MDALETDIQQIAIHLLTPIEISAHHMSLMNNVDLRAYFIYICYVNGSFRPLNNDFLGIFLPMSFDGKNPQKSNPVMERSFVGTPHRLRSGQYIACSLINIVGNRKFGLTICGEW